MSKLPRLVSGFLLIFVLAAWAWFGAMPLRQASLEQSSVADLFAGASGIDASTSWPVSQHLVSGVANYLGLPLSARTSMEEPTVARVRELGEAALSRRPLGVETWVLLAELEKLDGDGDGALAHARVGGVLGSQHPKYLDRLMPLFIRIGDIDSAKEAGGTLLASVPAARDRVYSQLLWSGVPAEELVKKFAPSAGDDEGVNEGNYWINTLGYAIRSRNAQLADALWDVAPDKGVLLAESGYPEFLLRDNNQAQLLNVLDNTDGPFMEVEREESLTFTNESNESLCWRLRAHKDANYDVTGTSSGDPVLKVAFPAGQNTAFSHVSCLIGVSPEMSGSSLLVTGQWRGAGLSTREGVYVEVLDARGGKFLNKSTERRYGDWPWEEFRIEFDVPEDSRLLQVRIARRRTNNLDNQFFGTVSFRDFRIGPVANVNKASTESAGL